MKGKSHAGERPKKEDVYAGAASNVDKEAMDSREPDEKESPTRKKGGKVEGKAMKKRLDRPGRKSGGMVGKKNADSVTSSNPDFDSDGKVGAFTDERSARARGGGVDKGGKGMGVGAEKKPLTAAFHRSEPKHRDIVKKGLIP